MTKTRQANWRSTIYKGSDGRWHGRVTVGLTDDGRTDRRHVASKSRSKVVERVRTLERGRDSGQLSRLPENWTVEAWLNHWLENVSRPFVKRSTYEGYWAAVRIHLVPGLGRHRLRSLRPEHLERLYVRMLTIQTNRGTMMSPGRVHQVHRTIRTALNEAVRRGYITQNPAKLAKTPTVPDHEVEPYSVAEVQRLLAAAKGERNGTRWVVALALGLRQGEALGLQWPDLDEVKGLVLVRRNRTRPRYEHGCAPACGHRYAGHCPQRRNTRPETDTTKSRAARRPVPVPAAVMALLAAHREAQAIERRTAAQLWSDQGYMFADELGRAINPKTDWDRWKRLLTAADVRDGRLHDARHTAATMLLLLGVHERTIMSVLGWSTTAMASRYTHVTGVVQADLAARIDALLWSSSDTGTETN